MNRAVELEALRIAKRKVRKALKDIGLNPLHVAPAALFSLALELSYSRPIVDQALENMRKRREGR